MQQRYIVVAIAVVIIVLAFFMLRGMNSKGGVLNYPSAGTDIVAYGDSYIAGYGSTQGNDFVSLLSKKIGRPIVNLGVNGDTTARGLDRIGAIDSYKPKVVLLLLGGNDVLQRVPHETTFKNLRTIITEFQERGAIVVVLSVRSNLVGGAFGGELENIVADMHTAYVPDVLDGHFGDRQYMSDEIHPNDAGYKVIAETIYPVLAPLLK
jgi:lysophospholipase L1-like esterase